MRALVLLLLSVLAGNEARAAPSASAALRFETKDGYLYVRRGKARARIDVEEAHPDMYSDLSMDVTAKADGPNWTLRVGTNCQGNKTMEWTTAALEARLESAAAAALARRKQWDGAAAGYARAVVLDPSYGQAATDLAIAQLKGGHRPEAIATLVAAAARDRIWVVARVAIDRALAPIASAPELRALAAKAPGHARLAKLGRQGVAFSNDGKLIAWVRDVQNMMSEEGGYAELRVADVAAGRLLTRMRFRDAEDKGVDRALADLGFDVEKVAARELDRPQRDKQPDLIGFVDDIRVTVQAGRIRLSAKGQSIAQARTGMEVDGGWAGKVRGGMLVVASVNIGDGCGAWAYDDVVWIPLKAAPP